MHSIFPKRDNLYKPCHTTFSIVYDKYANALYRIFLDLSDTDTDLAAKLLNDVFVEAFSEKTALDETIPVNFIQLVKVATMVAKRYGYQAKEIIQSIRPHAAVPGFPGLADQNAVQLSIG